MQSSGQIRARVEYPPESLYNGQQAKTVQRVREDYMGKQTPMHIVSKQLRTKCMFQCYNQEVFCYRKCVKVM